MKKNFLICGFIGWCLEILWTGLHSILAGELTMTARTSLLMFPIYGCATIIRPVSARLSKVSTFILKWNPFAPFSHVSLGLQQFPFQFHGRDPF